MEHPALGPGETAGPHASVFVIGSDRSSAPLVLLHGSDGTERDLLPLAEQLAPDASRLSIRGTVRMDGGYGFFHRREDRRVDEDDLLAREPVLADFITRSLADHSSSMRGIAVGYSNGAIMAAALLLRHPALLAGAILLRPLPPFTDVREQQLEQVPVLVIEGSADARRGPRDGLALADQLRRSGATVSRHRLRAGHELTAEDVTIARDWLGRLRTPSP